MSQVSSMAVNGALPVSPQERVEYTPPRYATLEGVTAPVFVLHPLKIRERQAVGLAVQRQCGFYVSDDELLEILRDAATQALEPEDATRALEVISEFEDLKAAVKAAELAKEKVPPDAADKLEALAPKVDRLERRLSRRHEELREALSARTDWTQALYEWTVRATVLDWHGLSAPCVRRNRMVTAESLTAIPEEDWQELASTCLLLKEVTPDLERDSVSP